MAASKDSGVRAGDGFCLRTPLLPMTMLDAWASSPDPRAYLAALVDRPEIREALFVASPSLASAIEIWKTAPTSPAGQRAEPAIAKYVARMMGRSTPFGLFSGVSAGKLGRESRLELAPRSEYRRRTRLDNDYLFVLIGELLEDPAVRDALRYRPNNSIYRTAGRMRYAGARLAGAERSYHLISVELTDYLEASLERARAGARPIELIEPLVGDDITLEDARAYVEELIAAQVIVPELGVHVTGPEPIDGVIDHLQAAGTRGAGDPPTTITGARAILADVRTRIADIDACGVGNPTEHYTAIATALEPLPAKVDMSRLFQVDMVKPATASLSPRIAADLAAAVHKLAQLSTPRGVFDDWKRSFRDRWEDRMVPLAEALDEESGLGFESARGPGAEGSPLLAGLPFPGGGGENRTRWGAFEQHMLSRLTRALAAGEAEIALDDADFETMKQPTPIALPDAFSAMVRIAATPDELARGEGELLFEGINGPSGARILGRFCHASAELDDLVRTHHALEESLRPDAAFAEIVHLNEGRIGNILCRPVLRAHEIVYLGISGAPEDKQLPIDDLRVGLRGDRIVLWSRRLDREVLPRLTTAHNFRLRSLAVYRFLCALASQGTDGVGWSWGPLASAPYLPRVRLGRVVLSRATWNLSAAELAPITSAVRAARRKDARVDADRTVLAAVAALREARALPRWLVVAAADNELPIDLDNPLLANAFADELSGARTIELTELFPSPDRLAVQGPEGAFANEVVLTFTRTPKPAKSRPTAPKTAPTAPRLDATPLRREFPPGSEWLFAKIYCGESTGDRVLREAIAPVARAAIESGDARLWFFLRYADPDSHVRVRFAGDPARLVGSVLPALERALAPLGEVGAVRKLMLDTYVRETERYGGVRGIELVEQLFWRDSEAVLGIVELLDGDAGGEARWKLAVRGIDTMLASIGLDPDARAKVVGHGRDMLGREFRADASFWTRVGERFTRERADLEVMFDRDPARDAAHDYEPGFAVLARRDAQLAEIGAELGRLDAANRLAPGLADFAWSLVHMHANRILHASQRAQEMILYDFVRRLHAARKARARPSARDATT